MNGRLGLAGCRLSELQRLLACCVLRRIGFVGSDNPLHERVPHHVSFIEVDEADSFDAGDHVSGFNQSR